MDGWMGGVAREGVGVKMRGGAGDQRVGRGAAGRTRAAARAPAG
jgi:hypothetical protein